MAWIELSRYEAETGDLPEVCMRCGEPATVRKRYSFPWHPAWVSVLIPFGYVAYVIVAALLTQNVRCTTFLCDRHRSHWRVRTLLIWGTFLALVAALAGGLTLAEALSSHLSKPARDWVFGSLCIAAPVLLVCWFISIPIIQGTAIQPTDVTERRLRLKGVSPLFVAAVQEYRQSRKDAMLPEDYDRKFQPERGGRTEEGGERYTSADSGRDPPETARGPQ